MKTKDIIGSEPERRVVGGYDPKMLDRVLLMKPVQIDRYWRNLRRNAQEKSISK